jgi:hypothetical protein
VLDIHLNSAECCLGDESYNSLEEIYESKSDIVNFDQCLLSDEVRNIEITKAINQIESGEQFAFYNLGFTEEEKRMLSEMEITEFNNMKIDNFWNIDKEVRNALVTMKGVKISETDKVAKLITRLVGIVVGEMGVENYELSIRSRESYESEEDCLYWHLDKSEGEVSGNSDNREEKRFIMVLKGNGTVYQKINEKMRGEFMKIAEEAPYYYGHGLDGCKTNDKINQLFKYGEEVETKEQDGSIHIAGSNGAMHAAPKESEGRLILLLTPKNNSTK